LGHLTIEKSIAIQVKKATQLWERKNFPRRTGELMDCSVLAKIGGRKREKETPESAMISFNQAINPDRLRDSR